MAKAVLFRTRAGQLRRLAKDVPDAHWRKQLTDLADEYEAIACGYEANSTLAKET
jgi:hypothetical protein